MRISDWSSDVCSSDLPKETVATCDTGAHRILFAQMWEATEPRTVLQSTGLCTMGCALPLAIGAQLAAPERPVVAFTGDGGLLMVAGELSRSEEHTSELQSLMRISYAVFCLKKKKIK